MFVHLCLSVLLTVISLIVFICTVTYELINDDDDDDNNIYDTHAESLNNSSHNRGIVFSRLHWLKASERISYKVAVLAYYLHVKTVLNQRPHVTNYVDQRTLKPDDDYVLPHQLRRNRLSTVGDGAFPVRPTAACLWNSIPSHVTVARPLSPSSAVFFNHISSHFLIPLSDFSLICRPTCSARAVTRHFGQYNCYYI